MPFGASTDESQTEDEISVPVVFPVKLEQVRQGKTAESTRLAKSQIESQTQRAIQTAGNDKINKHSLIKKMIKNKRDTDAFKGALTGWFDQQQNQDQVAWMNNPKKSFRTVKLAPMTERTGRPESPDEQSSLLPKSQKRKFKIPAYETKPQPESPTQLLSHSNPVARGYKTQRGELKQATKRKDEHKVLKKSQIIRQHTPKMKHIINSSSQCTKPSPIDEAKEMGGLSTRNSKMLKTFSAKAFKANTQNKKMKGKIQAKSFKYTKGGSSTKNAGSGKGKGSQLKLNDLQPPFPAQNHASTGKNGKHLKNPNQIDRDQNTNFITSFSKIMSGSVSGTSGLTSKNQSTRSAAQLKQVRTRNVVFENSQKSLNHLDALSSHTNPSAHYNLFYSTGKIAYVSNQSKGSKGSRGSGGNKFMGSGDSDTDSIQGQKT